MNTISNTSPYSKIFHHNAFKGNIGKTLNQLLGFTVLYDMESNRVNREELLDKIVQLYPSPHSIFPDKQGYLLRFELDKPFDVEDEEHENKLRESIFSFLEENEETTGKLQELEIGRWIIKSVQLNEECRVIGL